MAKIWMILAADELRVLTIPHVTLRLYYINILANCGAFFSYSHDDIIKDILIALISSLDSGTGKWAMQLAGPL